jgi:hypothetical protein
MTAESFIARRRQERLEELTRENLELRRRLEQSERLRLMAEAELGDGDRWTR